MNFTIDAFGRGKAWAIDPDGHLISQLYLTPAEYQARADLVLIEPPNPAKGYLARFADGAWVEEPRKIQKESSATLEQIRQWRKIHENSPIITANGVVDADFDADVRMADAVENFNELPTLQKGRLSWTLADNSAVLLTVGELAKTYTEMKKNRAIRRSLLHKKAVEFKAMSLKPTLTQLTSIDFWMR